VSIGVHEIKHNGYHLQVHVIGSGIQALTLPQ
jgi:hypothetical protein